MNADKCGSGGQLDRLGIIHINISDNTLDLWTGRDIPGGQDQVPKFVKRIDRAHLFY